ncbi:MAG TPA: hypothetical protein VFZ41_05715 [Solirubrobacterales bacterium]
MDERLTPRGAYLGIWRIYRRWAPSLLLLGLIVFVPLGLINALTVNADLEDFGSESLLTLIGTGGVLLVLGISSLLGEVFYTGVVAASLTHSHDDRPPSLREIARSIRYRRLIAVDVIYGVLVAIGVLLLVLPGLAVFVWLALAAPVVEIEGRGVRAALTRSVRLVRRRFWTVLSVLLPIGIVGESIAGVATRLSDDLLGDVFISHWLSEVLTSLALTPFFAVAAVLITVTLIREKEGRGPRLHSSPVRA